MTNRSEIRLTGSGGQGLILAGIILAEAAILDGLNAIQSQSYGPEARGGASKAEVIISNEDIFYPKILDADVLLCLTRQAYCKYITDLKDGGLLIIDSDVEFDTDRYPYDVIRIPVMQTAEEEVGKAMVANIVALGVIQEATNVVTKESLEKAVLKRVPPGTQSLNKLALAEGYKLVEKRR